MTFIRKSPSCLLLTILLASCSSYEVDFDCPAGKGLPCASLSEVNRQIDLGALGGEEEGSPLEASLKRGSSCSAGDSCQEASFTGSEVLFYHPPQRLSSGEVLPGSYVRVRGEP